MDNNDEPITAKTKESETEKKTTIEDETDNDGGGGSAKSSSESGGSMVAVVGGPVCETKDESGYHIRITPGFEDGYCDVCCEKKAVRLVLEFVNGKLKRKAGVCDACGNSQKSGEDLIKEYGKEPELKEEEEDAEARKDPSR